MCFDDQILTSCDCGTTFLVTAGDQHADREKGFGQSRYPLSRQQDNKAFRIDVSHSFRGGGKATSADQTLQRPPAALVAA